MVNLFSFDFMRQMHPGVLSFYPWKRSHRVSVSASTFVTSSPCDVSPRISQEHDIWKESSLCNWERWFNFWSRSSAPGANDCFHWKASITDDVKMCATWRKAGFNTDTLRSFSKVEGCWGVWWCGRENIPSHWHGSMTLNWTTDLPLSISATKH